MSSESLSVLYQVLPTSQPSGLRSSASSVHNRTPARTPPRSPATSVRKLDPLSSLPTPTSIQFSDAHSTTSLPSAPAAASDKSATPPARWLALPYYGLPSQPSFSFGSLGHTLRMLSYETEKGIIVDHMGEMKQGGDWARTWLHAGVKVEVIAVRDRDPGLDQELPAALSRLTSSAGPKMPKQASAARSGRLARRQSKSSLRI